MGLRIYFFAGPLDSQALSEFAHSEVDPIV
jgi:hypothetical protein